MQLEDYFHFEKFDTKFGVAEEISLKETRITLDTIVEEFNKGMAPSEIVENYPTLTLEQVYAAVAYYLHNKSEVDDYIRRGDKINDAFYEEHLARPPDAVTLRLRALVAQREAQELNGG